MKAQTVSTDSKDTDLLHQPVLGSRRFSNLFWATVIAVGATGFLLSGISSYLHVNLLPFSDPTALVFVPQGLVMGLYGAAGMLLALYLWLAIAWDVGGGHNRFDRKANQIQILRWGYPGKNRQVVFECPFSDVQSVRVEIREGLNPKRALYLKLKNRREIPLTRVGQPLPLAQIEQQGAELARFLGVPLEGI